MHRTLAPAVAKECIRLERENAAIVEALIPNLRMLILEALNIAVQWELAPRLFGTR